MRFVPFAVLMLTQWALAQSPSAPLRTPPDRPIDIQHIRLDLGVDLRDRPGGGLSPNLDQPAAA